MKIIGPGTRILFRRADGELQRDTVRDVFWQDNMQPGGHAPGAAVTLTGHSWCWMEDIAGVFEPEHCIRYATDEERSRTPVARYGCTGCPDTFADITQAARHLRQHHTTEEAQA